MPCLQAFHDPLPLHTHPEPRPVWLHSLAELDLGECPSQIVWQGSSLKPTVWEFQNPAFAAVPSPSIGAVIGFILVEFFLYL